MSVIRVYTPLYFSAFWHPNRTTILLCCPALHMYRDCVFAVCRCWGFNFTISASPKASLTWLISVWFRATRVFSFSLAWSENSITLNKRLWPSMAWDHHVNVLLSKYWKAAVERVSALKTHLWLKPMGTPILSEKCFTYYKYFLLV